ncbi:hypothetical protein G9A89_023307 [Geosiphon pyriformis]|nr:hypothetical protein G9A89_023307 [Geosiphon pyriformis]
MPSRWAHQYAPLDYVKDDAFFDVMNDIHFNELVNVILDLPDSKAAGLSGISNELWKHCSDDMLGFDVLQSDNFSVLKGMSTQSLVFAIGSIIEDALEKNREVWLVLQDMHKTYNSVVKFGKIKSGGGRSSFLAAGAFVDDTIWIGNGQASTQCILDIVGKFFEVNDIAINSEKTVAILINKKVLAASLHINGLSISITKQGEAHRYLGIFLSTNGLFKPSLAKAQSDVSIKTFEQIQAEGKVASLVWFSNTLGILGHLFEHHFLDLQILGWASLNPLQHSVKLRVSSSNNFFTGVVRIFLDNDICLANNLPCAFCGAGRFSVLTILVYTNGSLSHLGTAKVAGGAAAYFPDASMGIGVEVSGLFFSTMAELYAVALALECVPFLCSVVINTDSQAAIDACVSELSLIASDFRNKCWVERHYICKLIENKDLSVKWVKVKSHSGDVHNDKTNALAEHAAHSDLFLPMSVRKRYVMACGQEAGPGSVVIDKELIVRVDWKCTASVWHPNSHMLSGFISQALTVLHTYLMKVVHKKLPVAVRKRLYDKCYPGVLCLMCGDVELSDHIFTCQSEAAVHTDILLGRIAL